MLRQLEDLYIPQDERTLQRVQRRAQELDERVRGWAESVARILPKGLPLLDDELYIFTLFLAHQRRLNLEMDAQNPRLTFRSRLGRVLPFVAETPEHPDILRAVHRVVANRVESDIDRACGFFCRDHNVPAISDPAIDWRVAIRFMAQSTHNIASHMDVRNYMTSPRRFELAVISRDLATAVLEKRRLMVAAFSSETIEQ